MDKAQERQKILRAKWYLRQIETWNGKIERLSASVAHYRDLAVSLSSQIGAERVDGGSDIHDRIGEAVAKYIDCETRLLETVADAEERRRETISLLELLEDDRERAVLFKRYVQLEPWKNIKQEIAYERTQMYEIHRRALLSLGEILDAVNAE